MLEETQKYSTLSHLNTALSQQLFQTCRAGQVITKEVIHNDNWQPNPVFSEVMFNLDDYKELVLKTGYELVVTSDSIYFVNPLQSMESRQSQPLNFKAKVLLTVIIKYLNVAGKTPSYVTSLDSSSGLTLEDFEKMQDIEGVKELLQRSGFVIDGKENPMYDAVKTILVDRGFFAEKTSSKKYVATSAGQAWFDALKERGAEELI